MKTDLKEAERMTELLKRAGDHPMMKAILAEERAAVLAKRLEVAGKIEAVKKERDAKIPKLQADIDGKETEFKEAKAVMEAAGLGQINCY